MREREREREKSRQKDRKKRTIFLKFSFSGRIPRTAAAAAVDPVTVHPPTTVSRAGSGRPRCTLPPRRSRPTPSPPTPPHPTTRSWLQG